MSYPYLGLFEKVAELRALERTPPRPVIEPAALNPSQEQFLAVDEQAGITYE